MRPRERPLGSGPDQGPALRASQEESGRAVREEVVSAGQESCEPLGRGLLAPSSVGEQEGDPGSQLALTRRLLALRRERPALRLGSMTVTASEGTILAFERAQGSASLLCVFNLGGEPAAWSPADADAWTVIETVNGASLGFLPAYGGLIAERKA